MATVICETCCYWHRPEVRGRSYGFDAGRSLAQVDQQEQQPERPAGELLPRLAASEIGT